MKKKIATTPRLVKGKKWYIYFSIRNPKTNKMSPQKIYRGFKDLKTEEEKINWGNELIKEFTNKIKAGWTPWDFGDSIYEDEIQYKNESLSFGALKNNNNTVRMLSSTFLQDIKNGLKPKTYATYQSKLRIFNQYLEHKILDQYDISLIDNKVIKEFFEWLIYERKLDKVTIKGYKIKIKKFFDFLIKKEIVFKNPIYDLPKCHKVIDNAPRPFFKYDLKKYLTFIQDKDPQLFLACLMQYYCAIRPGTELRLLKIKDIDVWRSKIYINSIDSKMGRKEVIDIPEQLKDILTNRFHVQNYNSEFYLFSHHGIPGKTSLGHNNLRNRFNKYRDLLNMSKDYKFYSLKHTGASLLLDSGVSITELMSHLRHTDIESTYHYIKTHTGAGSDKIKHEFPDPM